MNEKNTTYYLDLFSNNESSSYNLTISIFGRAISILVKQVLYSSAH